MAAANQHLPGAVEVTHPSPVPAEPPGPILVGGTVHVGHAVDIQSQSADYGGWSTWKLTGAEQPFQILPYDPNRHRAVISVTVPPASGLPAIGQGVVSAPTAGQTISSVALADGAYMVSGAVELAGTLAAPADLNNFGFYIGSTLFLGMLTPPLAGLYTIPPSPVTIPLGGATLSTKAIGAGTAGSVYGAAFECVAGAPGTLVYVGTQAQCLTKTGGVIMPGAVHVVENNQALWCAGDGINPVNVTVLNERWS